MALIIIIPIGHAYWSIDNLILKIMFSFVMLNCVIINQTNKIQINLKSKLKNKHWLKNPLKTFKFSF